MTNPREVLDWYTRKAEEREKEEEERRKLEAEKDRANVYFFALRYALPRKTFALLTVREEWRRHMDYFETWEIEKAIDEIKEQLAYDNDVCDEATMHAFIADLQLELGKRHKSG